MKTTTIFLSLLLGASSAACAEISLLERMGALSEMFDSGLDRKERAPSRAVPFAEGRWSAAAKMEGVAQPNAWIVYRDAFAGEECRIVDAVYVRRPTLEEAAESLKGCLKVLSETYRTTITVTRGEGGLVIVVSGIIPSGSTVAADLRHAVELRESRLFGHPAEVLRLAEAREERKMSSLQFVVDRCLTIKMIHSIRTGGEFLAVYGDCIRQAKNLSIRGVLPHPTQSDRILVYSEERRSTIEEMRGIVRVVADGGPVQFYVDVRQETLQSDFLPLR